jgi:hypothetical protein
MPIHDWTRVNAGTWHAFHLGWIAELQNALNDGRLPDDYYAQAEQIIGPFGPDVLTLQEADAVDLIPNSEDGPDSLKLGGVAVAMRPPPTRWTAQAEMDDYVSKRRTMVIRHSSNDRIVALIEIVSPGNKSTRHALTSFVEKAVEAIYRGYHMLIVDLFPPGPRDPHGIHEAIWSEIVNDRVELPPNEPLTLVSYASGPTKHAYIEPTAINHALIDMPLFLTPDRYIPVPLEETYLAAYHGVPRRWRVVLQDE